MISYKLEFEEIFEFDPVMPVQLFSRACSDTRPIFLTDQFLSQIANLPPQELADLIVEDLRHGSLMSSDSLRLFYMLMDFNDFNRMMMLAAQNNDKPSDYWDHDFHLDY